MRLMPEGAVKHEVLTCILSPKRAEPPAATPIGPYRLGLKPYRSSSLKAKGFIAIHPCAILCPAVVPESTRDPKPRLHNSEASDTEAL